MRWDCEPLTTGFVSHPLFFLFLMPSLLDSRGIYSMNNKWPQDAIIAALYLSYVCACMYFYIIWSPEVSHMFHLFPCVFPHYCMKTHLLNKCAFRVFLTLMSMNVKNAVFCLEIMLDLKKALKPLNLLLSKSICLFFFTFTWYMVLHECSIRPITFFHTSCDVSLTTSWFCLHNTPTHLQF